MSKRALIVTTVPITLQAFLLPLSDALRKRGWTVDALTGQTQDEVMAGDTTELEAHFDTIHQIGWDRTLSSLTHLPELARRIRELIAQHDYDVVHVHTPIAAFVTRRALKQQPGDERPHIIYTVHGFHFFDAEHPSLAARLFKAAERNVIGVTDDLVVMNDMDEIAGRELVSLTQLDERPATLHRIDGTGLDFGSFTRADAEDDRRALRESLGVPADGIVVGMIAEMNENKRHELVLKTAELLADRQPSIHFLLIGSGPLEESLKQTVSGSSLDGLTHFTGQIPHDEVRQLIRICDLGLLVSQREGLPRSLMEFVASGVAVIGTDTRGITDVVRDPSAISEPSAQALATMIEHFATDEKDRSALARQQYRNARSHYDLDIVIPQYIELFEGSDT
ncbi:MAG: glycosyltransferase [Coriobacteriia bacterium]|nr:glycosyltransferase [Coriobacteriia bacterium]